MKRTLITAVLALSAVALLTGCSDTPIRAEAPGSSTAGQTGVIPSSGSYTLYHVTKSDYWGAPATTEKIVTLDLKANDRVGFKYELAADKQFNPDARSSVVAFAGSSFSKDLGPVQSLEDHYYWCSPSEWDSFWAGRPTRVVAQKAIQY